jgi:hypothetical protein
MHPPHDARCAAACAQRLPGGPALRRTLSVGSMDSAEAEAPTAAGTELNMGGLELHSDLSPIRAWWLWCAFGNCLQLSNAAFIIVNGAHLASDALLYSHPRLARAD